MATLTCDIVTPAEQLLSMECYMVAVPGETGHMGFLPGHAPLMSTLTDGEVRIFSEPDKLAVRYASQGGYVQVTGEKVIVLADRALAADQIDVARAQAKVQQLESELASTEEGSPERALIAYRLRWHRTLAHVGAQAGAGA